MENIELDHDIKINFTHYRSLDAGSNNGFYESSLSKLYTMLSKPVVSSNKYKNGLMVSGKVLGTRNREGVKHKNLLLLDLDDLPAHYDLFSEFSSKWKYAFAVYTSYNHDELAPRYRLVIPINRNITPESYVALVKYIEKQLDLPKLDPKSYEYSQSFALPVVKSATQEYIFDYVDEEILIVSDELLQTAATLFPAEQSKPITIIRANNWQSILEPKSDGEGRNNAMTSILGSLLRRYVDQDLAYYLLRLWNDHHHDPMSIGEFDKSFKSILEKELRRRESSSGGWKDADAKQNRNQNTRWG